MKKLAIIDIDGVVADSTARFAKAEQAKQAAFVDRSIQLGERQQEATRRYWQTAFTPELVSLDVKIPGVNDALNALLEQDYQLIFLTSSPESMKEATLEWFSLNIFIKRGANIIFKAPAFQFTKTTVWKAGMVQTLASLYDASDMLVVDDEQANIDAILSYTKAGINWRFAHSLREAIAEE